MGQGAIDYIGVKGGLDINGIIESYYAYAGENISAGDFVEFITGRAGTSSIPNPTGTLSITQAHIYQTNAVLLDKNKVLLCWTYDGGYACILNFSEDYSTITYGTALSWETSGKDPHELSACKIDSTKVFISYSRRNNYNDGVCRVLSINGDTITAGAIQTLSSYQTNGTSCVYLPYSAKVAVCYRLYGSGGYDLYSVTATISGTSVSLGTATTVQSGTSSKPAGTGYTFPTKNQYFYIAYNYNSITYGCLAYISGTSISLSKTNITLYSGAGNYPKITKMTDDLGLFTYISSNIFYATVIKLDGTAPSNTVYNHTLDTTAWYSIFKLSTDNIFCLIINKKNSSSATNMHSAMLKVDNTLVTFGTFFDTGLSASSYTVGVMLNDEKVVAISIYKTYAKLGINGMIVDTSGFIIKETQVRRATSVPCNGVAKTSGEGGDETGHGGRVSVYVPLVIDNCEELLRNLTWTETTVGTKYVANDGTIISADSYNDTYDNYATYAFDNDTSTYFRTLNGTEHYLQIQFVEPIKVAFMQIMLGFSYNEKLLVQASNNGSVWTDLHDFGTGKIEHTELVTLDLTHVSESYSYYRIYTKSTQRSNGRVYEWKLWR